MVTDNVFWSLEPCDEIIKEVKDGQSLSLAQTFARNARGRVILINQSRDHSLALQVFRDMMCHFAFSVTCVDFVVAEKDINASVLNDRLLGFD